MVNRSFRAGYNRKRIRRVMQRHGLMLAPRAHRRHRRPHLGRIQQPASNQRCCSDVFLLPCWSGEVLSVAFAIDGHDREVLAYVASPRPLTGADIRTLLDRALWTRFGEATRKAPHAIQWLSDNAPRYTGTASVLYAYELGRVPITTPAYSPQSNGLAEALVKTFRADYVDRAELRDAEAVFAQVGGWLTAHFWGNFGESLITSLGARARMSFVGGANEWQVILAGSVRQTRSGGTTAISRRCRMPRRAVPTITIGRLPGDWALALGTSRPPGPNRHGRVPIMRTRHWAFHLAALAMIVMAVTACASGRASGTATPIESVASIAGTWTGTIEFGAGEQPGTLTIQPNGQAAVQARTMSANGTVSVQGGKATYDFPARSQGTVTLYQDAGKRQLNLKGMGGVFDMWVTPK